VVKVLGFFLFLVILISGVCLLSIRISSLIGCAGSVGIFLAGRVMYIFGLNLSAVGLAGRYKLFGHSGGVDGGTVQIFLFLWLYSGGYSTGEMVRGGGPFLSFAFFSLLSVLLADGYW
jgi:hypothetical protein